MKPSTAIRPRNRRVNEAIGCWPLSLWLPFSIYRSTHLAHHRDAQPDRSVRGSRKLLLDPDGWRDIGPLCARAGAGANDIARPHRPRPGLHDLALRPRLGAGAWRNERRARANLARHLILCVPVLVWVIGVCRHAVLALCRLLHLSRHEPRDGALLCRASRGRPRRSRTAIVESAWILGSAVPVQQPACGASSAPPAALVSDSEILPSEPRCADRAQRRAGLSWLFRRRAALSRSSRTTGRSIPVGTAARRERRRRRSRRCRCTIFPGSPRPTTRCGRRWRRGSREAGVEAPEALTRGGDLDGTWRDPGLLFGQTCGYPYVTRLSDAVTLIATPEYSFPGCEGGGASQLHHSSSERSAPRPRGVSRRGRGAQRLGQQHRHESVSRGDRADRGRRAVLRSHGQRHRLASRRASRRSPRAGPTSPRSIA